METICNQRVAFNVVALNCRKTFRWAAALNLRSDEGNGAYPPGITKHLRVLEDVGIVNGVRSGRETLFEFNPKPINEAKDYLDHVSEQWDDALTRLKSFLED